MGLHICVSILFLNIGCVMSIKVKGISKSFGDKKVLDNVSFEVDDGEALAIVGFSGSGKSTILKLICNLSTPDSGEIQTTDDNIAMVFQYSALLDSLNVSDNISFALRERKDFKGKYTENEIKDLVSQKLKMVGLEGIEENYPHELSGGMQKRVSFARAIITDPTIILYDEPTAGLDPVSSTIIEDYIVTLKNELKAASIVVTHQMSTILRTADRVIMLYDGKIVFSGTKDEFLKQDSPYTKQFINASIDGPMKVQAKK